MRKYHVRLKDGSLLGENDPAYGEAIEYTNHQAHKKARRFEGTVEFVKPLKSLPRRADVTLPRLTYAQVSTILAGLRITQSLLKIGTDGAVEYNAESVRRMEHFEDVEPLTVAEIDALCLSINTMPDMARKPGTYCVTCGKAGVPLRLGQWFNEGLKLLCDECREGSQEAMKEAKRA